MLIFEEFQLYAKNVRGNVSQNILRMMSVEANHKIRCLGITPDLSLIDCAFIRLAQQRYHFKLGNEPNAKRRFNQYYSKDWTRVARELDIGFCVYANKEKLKVVKIPRFNSDITPKPYCEPEPTKKPTIWQKIKNAINGSVYEESEPMDTEIEEDALIGEDLFEEEW